ncbi:MAG: hypothetical protein GEV06_27595 [Luteitalea sp.]|nr:hypothetical protein [Luteitalea sp.]
MLSLRRPVRSTGPDAQRCFRTAYRAYFLQIRRYTGRLSGDPAQAEDLAQDVFVRLWKVLWWAGGSQHGAEGDRGHPRVVGECLYVQPGCGAPADAPYTTRPYRAAGCASRPRRTRARPGDGARRRPCRVERALHSVPVCARGLLRTGRLAQDRARVSSRGRRRR